MDDTIDIYLKIWNKKIDNKKKQLFYSKMTKKYFFKYL